MTVNLPRHRQHTKEAVADRLGITDKRVEGNLRRFREFIETRGRETGAWRGEVPRDPTV